MTDGNLHAMREQAPLARAHGTVRDVLEDSGDSGLKRYRALTFPDGGVLLFVSYELAAMFLLPLPGAAGFWLRRKLLRPLFGGFGRNVTIGRNCVFRHPRRIFLGDGVGIDDNCLLDARGCGSEGLHVGAGTLIGRDGIIKSKAGTIRIGLRVNIGARTTLISHSGLTIGDDVGIAGGCMLNGGTFALSEYSKPLAERTPTSNGPIEIGRGVWLATGVTVLDGVRVGEHAVVASGSVVTHAVAARTVVQGNPAKKVFEIR